MPNLERGLFFNNETTDKCGHLARERRVVVYGLLRAKPSVSAHKKKQGKIFILSSFERSERALVCLGEPGWSRATN